MGDSDMVVAQMQPVKPKGLDEELKNLLKNAIAQGASDIHLTTGKVPLFRIHGDLRPQPMDALLAEAMERFGRSMVSAPEWKELQEKRELDFATSVRGLSRFRVNAFYQSAKLSFAIRSVPTKIPSLDSLQLPAVIEKLTRERKGLILVTGPTGSGKSTTLAAMIRHINHSMREHIITLEDPIEYVHKSVNSLIDQREVGVDTLSFANGLRASLRQDPDIILVGELRDLETISTAITAAETGHLVLGTLHTSSATSTVERVIDMFPPEQHGQIRSQLSTTLKAVIAQQLLPTKDGKGRRAATEVMVNTPAVRNLINSNKVSQLQNVLITGRKDGMHTMDMALRDLLKEGVVTPEAAAPFFAESN